MWLIVGLGNPGEMYAGTRHNAGFIFVDNVARKWEVRLKGKKFLAKSVEVQQGEETVMLACPQTYMNQSGLSVKTMLRWKKIDSSRLLVVYDDLDISLGDIRIRKQGSAGTHRGMQSIVQELGTTRFPRIRIGIGPLPDRWEATDYVLSSFKKNEWPRFEQALERACGALEMILAGDTEKAMSCYNRQEDTRNFDKNSLK